MSKSRKRYSTIMVTPDFKETLKGMKKVVGAKSIEKMLRRKLL